MGTSRPLPKLEMIRGSELEMATRRIPDWRKNARIRQRRLYSREPYSNFAVATNRQQFLSGRRQTYRGGAECANTWVKGDDRLETVANEGLLQAYAQYSQCT